MKFKKAFAWILAVAMVITLMPSMAFASTTNSVASVPTVAADGKIPPVELTLRVDDLTGWNGGSQKIKLTLENATWSNNPNGAQMVTSTSGAIMVGTTPVINVEAGKGAGNVAEPTIDNIKFTSVSDNSLEFEFYATAIKDDFITLKIADQAIKAGSDAGPLNIAIDGLDSKVTSKTITVANVGTSNTVSTVAGTVKTLPRGASWDSVTSTNTIGTSIEIRETAVNSLKAGSWQSFRLTAPKGVTFDIANTKYDGDLAVPANVNMTPVVSGDNRVVDVTFNVASNANTDEVRNVLVIKPAIIISRDAAEGDIAIQLVGGTKDGNYVAPATDNSGNNKISDASDLVIAKYGNEAVEVSTVEEIPTFISGYLKDTRTKDFTFKVTLKENMKNSLAAERYVDFELPEEVQISGIINAKLNTGSNGAAAPAYVTIGDFTNDANAATGIASTATIGSGSSATTVPRASTADTSAFSFEIPKQGVSMGSNGKWKDDGANTITFEVPVTVKADFAGDITCKVSGAKAGVEETELIVAKAESPIKVETKTTEVRNGVQTQAVADITITENYVGYLDDTNGKNYLTLNIDTLGLSSGMVFEDFDTVTVTEGDLELGKTSIANRVITIPIKHSSAKASTIEIKGLVVALNRTLPEGPYALQVDGSALVKNAEYDDTDFGKDPAVTVADYVKIVTPADPSTITNKINAVFTLRQDTFTNNGETVQMDTAPYLDANNRTQLPIRYAAIACGVPESDISWNQATQTATINGQNVVLRITIGSNIMQTSAGNVTMDTAAVSSNGRIFVPIRYIANALGADVAWDQDAKTITLTN